MLIWPAQPDSKPETIWGGQLIGLHDRAGAERGLPDGSRMGIDSA
jgi:hypothetical protein